MLEMTTYENLGFAIEDLIDIEELNTKVGVLRVLFKGEIRKLNSYIYESLTDAVMQLEDDMRRGRLRYDITIEHTSNSVIRVSYDVRG
jgi:non-canonical (house-cleaning) NTP pyrophosphatase